MFVDDLPPQKSHWFITRVGSPTWTIRGMNHQVQIQRIFSWNKGSIRLCQGTGGACTTISCLWQSCSRIGSNSTRGRLSWELDAVKRRKTELGNCVRPPVRPRSCASAQNSCIKASAEQREAAVRNGGGKASVTGLAEAGGNWAALARC